jgi:hypothetical protein
MMKRLSILRLACIVAFVAISSTCFGQHPQPNGPTTPVQVGTVTVNGGIGVGGYYNGDDFSTPFGLKAAVEFGLWQAGPGVVTLGGELGGSWSSGGYAVRNDYSAHTIIVAARAAWHYGWEVKGLDTYGGVSAGLGFHHYQYYADPYTYSHNQVLAVPGIFVGASYFVTPTFGFNAEAGHDITDFQVGVVFKLQ